MSIRLNVKKLRKQKKISPDYIAKLLGYSSRQWVYDLEAGKIERLTDETKEKLANILGVTVDELINGASEDREKDVPEFYTPSFDSGLNELKTTKEKYAFLLIENRNLWRENSLLKSILLKHKIDIYNTDNQDDTV